LSHDGERNQPNTFYIFFKKATHLYNYITFVYHQDFSRLVKEANETANLRACFFYNTSLYWITSLLVAITILYQQGFLIETFHTNKRVCLSTQIDTWLIADNR